MPVLVLLVGFYFVLLLLGCAMLKGHGGDFSTLRGFIETRGKTREEVARLTGKIVICTALFFLLMALAFSFIAGGFALFAKTFIVTIVLTLIAYLLYQKIPSKFV